jgi:hypothetical protein
MAHFHHPNPLLVPSTTICLIPHAVAVEILVGINVTYDFVNVPRSHHLRSTGTTVSCIHALPSISPCLFVLLLLSF